MHVLRQRLPILLVLLVVLPLAALYGPVRSSSATAGGAPLSGDANCDAGVDSVDALQVLRFVAGLSAPAGCVTANGDVDCSYSIDSVDALLVLRRVAGLPIQLPSGCPPIGTAIGEKPEEFSPGTISLSGLSESSFNALSSPISYQVSGASLTGVADDVAALINDSAVPKQAIEASASSILVNGILLDGPNDLVLLTRDSQGFTIYKEAIIWAGDADLSVTVKDETGGPMAFAAVTATLMEDASITAQGTTDVSGHVSFHNLPSRAIRLQASATGGRAASSIVPPEQLGARFALASAAAAAGTGLAEMDLTLPKDLKITRLGLNDIDNLGLRFLSTDEHPYFNGYTQVNGTITIEGLPCDELTSVELEVLEGGNVVATTELFQDARKELYKPFPITRRLEITESQLLFEIPGDQLAGVNRQQDGLVTLKVKAKTALGEETEEEFGDVPKLVRYTNPNRYEGRNPNEGGDDWVKPSVKPVVEHFAGVVWGDFSNMNGGNFYPPHASHKTGNDVDGKFSDGTPSKEHPPDADTAQRLIDYLNDPTYGSRISLIGVTYDPNSPTDPFWNAIQNVVLNDGRPAPAVIRPWAGHEDHFHWRISEAGAGAPGTLGRYEMNEVRDPGGAGVAQQETNMCPGGFTYTYDSTGGFFGVSDHDHFQALFDARLTFDHEESGILDFKATGGTFSVTGYEDYQAILGCPGGPLIDHYEFSASGSFTPTDEDHFGLDLYYNTATNEASLSFQGSGRTKKTSNCGESDEYPDSKNGLVYGVATRQGDILTLNFACHAAGSSVTVDSTGVFTLTVPQGSPTAANAVVQAKFGGGQLPNAECAPVF